MLSKVDIFDIRNNPVHIQETHQYVVNCSQKLISLIFGTTVVKERRAPRRCELLSKVDIFDIRNNQNKTTMKKFIVVNCSQKLISLIFGTTGHRQRKSKAEL